MTISGVTQTAQFYPMNNVSQVEQRPVRNPEEDYEAIQGAVQGAEARDAEAVREVESANVQMAVSVQVQDMAMQQMEDAANQLLQDVAAQTGIGQHINMLA